MNPPAHAHADSRLQTGHVVLLAGFALLVFGIVGVTGYFRLSSDTAALSSSLRQVVPGTWHKKIAVHVGGLTMAVVRHGLRLVHLPAEPRAAIEALRGAEVGVYESQHEKAGLPDASVLLAVDKVMTARGWERAVGVAHEDDLVAVYLPRKSFAPGKMKCCVMVLHGSTLVVASARGDLRPVLAFCEGRLKLQTENQQVALRRSILGKPHYRAP